MVDLHCAGYADIENNIPLRSDHLFRAFSNTKLVTSCAVMLLVEEGRLGLDDPVERYIVQLGNRRVLKTGAKSIEDTEPAQGSITIHHLLSHSSGLSYGLLDPGTTIYKAYIAANLNAKEATLALVVHPNTVYYRLERIAERTGCDVRQVDELIDLLLAVRLVRGD